MRRSRFTIAILAGASCAQAGAQPSAPPSAAAPAAQAVAYAPPSPAALARFEAAFAADDGPEAARILDDFTSPWLQANGDLRPNPLLSGLVGRYFAASGELGFALAYLRRADAPDVPEPQRSAALVALGEAEAAAGRLDAAALALRRAEALVSGGSFRARVELAAARVMAITDPRGALVRLQQRAGNDDPAMRFEAMLAAVRAHALLGDRSAAGAAAERAWVAAATLPISARAPLRAALLLAALAAQRGDEPVLLAMLGVAGARATMAPDVVDVLPLCGTSGLTAADHVTFALYSAGDRRPDMLEPVTASRAEAVRPFFEAIAVRDLLMLGDVAAGGLIFTVRCRSTPSTNFMPPVADGSWAEWFAARGMFGRFAPLADLDDIATLSTRVGDLETRFGTDDPRLIAARLDLATRLAFRAAVAGDADPREAARLREQAMAAMRRTGGAEAALAGESIATILERRSASGQSREAMRAELVEMIAGLPIDVAYVHAMWLSGDTDMPDEAALSLVRGLLARLPEEMDPRRRALTARLVDLLQRAGDERAARLAARAAGIAADDCRLLSDPPTVTEAGITNDDYPAGALEAEAAGISVIDFAVGADGRVLRPRIILSAPSMVFDRAAAAGAATFRFGPGNAGGGVRPCSGRVQRVIWRLPTESEPVPVAPPPPDPDL